MSRSTSASDIAELATPPITLCRRPTVFKSDRPHPLRGAIVAFGRSVTEIPDGPIRLDPDGVVWLQDNVNWFPKVCQQLLAAPRQERPFVVHWFSEPLPPPHSASLPRPRLNLREIAKIVLRDPRMTDVYSNAARLRSLAARGMFDLLVASTPSRQEFLADNGIAVSFVPLGYARSFHGHDMGGVERDVDVLFLGFAVSRRRKLLRQLLRAGIEVTKMGDWHDPDCWGDSRTRLLNRTKVFLNLARHPGELPGLRLILGMASKCLVVSEPIYEPGPYVPGEHFVSCSMEEMPGVIEHYLDHPEQRQRIVDAGHRLVTETLTLERSVEKVLDLVDERIGERAVE